jgi:hypothetical protein
MPTHWFRLTLAGKAELTDDEANTLYEAGCDDGTVVTRDGVALVGFARQAPSLGDAIGSAAKDVEEAGFKVARVEVEEPTRAGGA